MSLRIQKLALHRVAMLAPLLLLAACNISWPGQGRGIGERPVMDANDVAALQGRYDTQKYFRDAKRHKDGRENAFGRDLDNLTATFDRMFFNYSKDDPYVNHPSTVSNFNHMMRFAIDNTYPLVSNFETGSIVHK